MRKLTFTEVKDGFNKLLWEVVSTEYFGSQKPLNVICPEGHTTTITWNNFQRGQGCRVCAGNEKFTLEQVQKIFSDANCELLTTHYEDSKQKLNYKCVCGETSFIRVVEFNRGHRCQKCKSKTLSSLYATPEEEIKIECEKHGCKLIRSFMYKKHMRIEYICKCHRTSEAYWCNFKKFPNCKQCGAAKISGSNCYMYDPDREAVALRKRFRKMCGQHIHRFMKATGQKKTRSTHLLLGYRPIDLQEHITSHPDYKSCVEQGDWHVDHIFPIQAFLDHKIYDLSLINHLSNLRPIPGPDNLSKADVYDEKEFEQWLETRC
jgi:hypothetical protein